MLDKYDTERRTVISSLVFHQNRMDTSGVNSSAAGQQDSNNGHHNGMDSEEILDNPVSLSSAVVSGDYTADSYSRDLLMIAPQSKTEISPDDPRFVVPPLVQTSKMTPKITVYSSTDDENEGDTLLTSWQSDLKSPRREELVKYFGYTKNQWFAFVTLAIANIFATAIFSIQAPFYPREAEEKGATPTEHGLVLGIFELVVFIMSPIYGSLLGKSVAPKLMYNIGIFGSATCTILFGFLQYVEGRALFIGLSFAIRIVQGCGEAAIITAAFTIIAMEFPESVATTFAALETCAGVGLVIGPTIGGALYEVGGFVLPYITMGTLLLLVAIFAFISLRRLEARPEYTKNPKGFIALLRIPAVALAGFSIFVAGSSIGFLTATLEPHLRDKFNLTPLYTGLIFIIDGGMYALSAPVWGRIVDRGSQPKWITLTGCTLTFTGFLFIGPAPFMPFDTVLWLVCVGLVIHGLGLGASLVSGFIQALQDATKRGFPDNVQTYGIVSGLWSSTFALGLFIGPSVGGALLDLADFRTGTYYVLGSQIVVAVFVIIYICTTSSSRKSKDEEQDPLLSHQDLQFGSPTKEIQSSNTGKHTYGAVECCPSDA